MTLTDGDKADVLSLLSSLGDPESTARASELAATSEDAAEYFRQMQAIAAALSPPEDISAPLTPEQVLDIRNKVLRRRGKKRPGPWSLGLASRLLSRRYAAIAAAILLFLGPGLWFLYRGKDHHVIAEAILVPSDVSLQTAVSSSRFPVLPGTALETGEQLAGIALRNGNRIYVGWASKVDIVGEEEVRLVAGSCFIRAVAPIRVLASAARLEVMQGAVHAHVIGDLVLCQVFSGSVTAKTAGKTAEIRSGTAWEWHSIRNTFVEGRLVDKPPGMVDQIDSLWRREGVSR